jgi:hypothetical protein
MLLGPWDLSSVGAYQRVFAVDGNTAYHLMHNTDKILENLKKI